MKFFWIFWAKRTKKHDFLRKSFPPSAAKKKKINLQPHFVENAYFWHMFGKTLKKGCFSLPPKVSIHLILFFFVSCTPLHSLQTYPQGVGNTSASPRDKPLTPPQVLDPTPTYGLIIVCSLTWTSSTTTGTCSKERTLRRLLPLTANVPRSNRKLLKNSKIPLILLNFAT